MPQFFVPKKNIRTSRFYFDPQESHHLAKVLRKKISDSVQIFDGEGNVWNAKITEIRPERVEGEIVESSRKESHSPKRNLILYPALIKGPAFDWMLQKVTELGVNAIAPILTQRCVIKDLKKKKLDRWKKILQAAAKQSGQSKIPDIEPPLQFSYALPKLKGEKYILFFWEGEESCNLKNILPTLREGGAEPIHLFIGPEGGFTIEEAELAKSYGAIHLRLGEAILRAETAAIAAVSAIQLS